MILSREYCEKEFSLALSRYVGYTTGAYYVTDRIKSILPEFDSKPYVLEIEIINKLQKTFEIKAAYAQGLINFTAGLGFINRNDRAGMPRLTLTDLGRTLRSSIYLEDCDFSKYILSYSVIAFDCDVYGLLLDLADKDKLPNGDTLYDSFLSRTINLRNDRFRWLNNAFPNEILRKRIEANVLWIKSKGGKTKEILDPGRDFARHHAAPRRGWAQSLGHLSEDNRLTMSGIELLRKIRGNRSRYFWIAPEKRCFDQLKVRDLECSVVHGPIWNLFRGKKDTDNPSVFIGPLSEFMVNSYPFLKLANMNQASLNAVKPYLYYLESKLNIKYNENDLFKILFSEMRDVFSPLSSRKDLLGHYQLRKKLK